MAGPEVNTPRLGDRVRFTVEIDRYPFALIPAGSTGTVTVADTRPEVLGSDSAVVLSVTLDRIIPDLEEWGNSVEFYGGGAEVEIGTLEVIEEVAG